jgi:hypothetical protein
MSLIPRDLFRQEDFFAPFFGGWPFETGALTPTTGATQQVASRSMPVDVMEVSPTAQGPLAALLRPRLAVIGVQGTLHVQRGFQEACARGKADYNTAHPALAAIWQALCKHFASTALILAPSLTLFCPSRAERQRL